DSTFTAPDYPSAECTPEVSGLNLGLAPQQWNAIAGLPLTPSDTPAAQRIVIGEFDETANEDAVNLLLEQCGLDPITLTEHTNSNGVSGVNVGGLESTLDVTVAAAALPDNASITIVNSPSSEGWYGMFVNMAEACGLEFDGDPWSALSPLSPGPNYPAGGCIMSLSYGGAESKQGDTSNADYVLDQLAANGVIVVVSAGDEGSGGCISAGGVPYGSGTLIDLTSFASSSNIATLTASADHGFTAGQTVFIGALAPQLDGNYRILSVPSSSTFTVAMNYRDQTSTTIAAKASVDFGGLEPQYPATSPHALAVGGTQWTSQANTLANALSIGYVPGSTLSLSTWWDSNPNANCANLGPYPTRGGEATGGGQSGKYAMPSYQQTATTANYPSAPSRRMMPDVAALAGWPTYAIANPGVTIRGVARTNNVATLYLGNVHGFEVGEEISVSLMPESPIDYRSFEVDDATLTAVGPLTISYANTGSDVEPDSVASGTLSQSCTAPCSASEFPWYPVVGTSGAAPLTAIGIANVNAVLSARGLPRLDNDGGSTDIHSVVYASTYAAARTDVTTGSNDIHALGGYTALPGYDMVTGMGTLNFSTLASRLISELTPDPGGGGGGTPAPPTTPAQPGDPIVNPPAVVSPDPVEEVVVDPVLRDLGRGVLASTGPNTAFTKRLFVKKRATPLVREAPRKKLKLNKWRVPIVRVPGGARDFTAEIRVFGDWEVLGGVVSNRRGQIALPAVRVTRKKNYRIRLTDAAGDRFFVVLRGRR
ncbi:MAG TPA: hypothetical protein VIG24_05940, partial [Acidimicrobiia bacterium]